MSIITGRRLNYFFQRLFDVFAKKSLYDDYTVNVGRKEGSKIGARSFAFGNDVEASGLYSHAFGIDNVASGDYSQAFGTASKATGWGSHAFGEASKASGMDSCAGGGYSEASGLRSFAYGSGAKAVENYSVAFGESTTTENMVHGFVVGKYNVKTGTIETEIINGVNYVVNNLLIVGNGSVNARSNAFRITDKGTVYGKTYMSSGADYAEFVKEWYDGNVEGEDRVGYFVTVKEGYLYKANSGESIIGITSGAPSVIGNADEEYYWRYERDDFNRIIYEEVPECIEKIDKDGNIIVEKTGRMVSIPKQSDTYDVSKQSTYIERKYRKEWDYVGMLGVLSVRDDGTCIAGKFCKCGKDGIATFAAERDFDTFLVLERISEKVVSVELR